MFRMQSGFVQWPIAIAFAALFLLAFSGDRFLVFLATTACVSYVLALSYNLLYGYVGVFSLAHVAIFGIGSYAAVIAQTRAGLPFLVALVIAIAASAGVSALLWLPTRRLKGLFLAIATLGFATAVSEAFLKWTDVTGGAEGIYAIPFAKVAGRELPSNGVGYLLLCAFSAFVCWRVFARLERSLLRVEMTALRSAPNALVSVGGSPARPSLAAFVVSGSMAGLSGVLFAHQSLYISADSFDLHRLILLILAVQLGGPGTKLGPVIGVAAMLVIDEIGVATSDHKDLIMGLAVVVLLGYSRAGLVPMMATQIRRVVPRRRVSISTTARDAAVELGALGIRNDRPVTLAVSDVGVSFGGVRALNGVELSVRSGEVLGLIGPNGAGKSTLVNVMTGFVQGQVGEVTIDGVRLDGLSPDAVARLGVVRTFQSPQLMTEASAIENVMLGYTTRATASTAGEVFLTAAARRDVDNARAAAIDLLLDLGLPAEVLAQPIGSQPYAWQRMVEIARALITAPRFLLLDEPGAGINEEEREFVATMIRRVADAGVGVILIDHNVSFVRNASTSIVVLSQGEVLMSGEPDLVLADEQVAQVYFGGAHA